MAGKNLRLGGFKTLPFGSLAEGGFYLLAADEAPHIAPGPERIIALRTDEGRIKEKFSSVFDALGVSLLSRSLTDDVGLILMDELGFWKTRP